MGGSSGSAGATHSGGSGGSAGGIYGGSTASSGGTAGASLTGGTAGASLTGGSSGANATGGTGKGGSGFGGSGQVDGCDALYVMFDLSGSMSKADGAGTRLDAVRSELLSFVEDPAHGALSMGIGYFGQMLIGSASCDPADYQTPEVSLAPLAGNGTAWQQSLAAKQPTGETPTGPAIRGACEYVKGWRTLHGMAPAAILLVTDGLPEAKVTSQANPSCNPTLTDAKQAATACAETGIKIYVLGVGSMLDALNQLAASGGTGQAWLVESGNQSGAQLQQIAARACGG